MAAWPSGLGKGLQSPVPGFDSRRRLPVQKHFSADQYITIPRVSRGYEPIVRISAFGAFSAAVITSSMKSASSRLRFSVACW